MPRISTATSGTNLPDSKSAFGARLRELRKAKKWSLKHTSEITGVPISTLSRIENNAVSPTLDIVMKIVRFFEITPLDALNPYSNVREFGEISFVKKNDGPQSELPNIIFKPLHYGLESKTFHPILLTLFARSVEEYGGYTSHEGHEFLYLISGKLEVHFESGEIYVLDEGDSIYFASRKAHAYVSKGPAQAKALIVASVMDAPLQERVNP